MAEQGHPLAFAQERFWFLDQLEPGSPEFHVTGIVQLSGRLDLEVLRAAFADVAARHESLCSSFPAIDGRPSVVVRRMASVPLTLRSIDGDLERHARSFHQVPFDLARGPLWRAQLVELGPDEFVLFTCLHHIIADGWSMGIFARELAAHYGSRLRGEIAPAWPTPASYRELARRERARLDGPGAQAHVDHWRRALAGAPPATELPFDRALPKLATHAGRTLNAKLSPACTAAIKTLAADSGGTPYQVLLALFAGFLGRIDDPCDSAHAAERDVVIGTSYAGRDNAETGNVIGAFVGTLALRLTTPNHIDLVGMQREVRSVLRAATEHAALPFERLVSELSPTRDARRTPLFNVFFELVVRPELPTWDGLDVRELDIDLGQAPFDLALAVDTRGSAFGVRLQYKTALFDRATIAELWASFELFAEAATRSPTTPLDQLPLVPRERLREQLRPDVPAPAFEPLHVTLATAAKAHPERPAIGDMTHQDLDREADQLAAALFEILAGPAPGTPIGVALPRSVDSVLAALAIWKSGCAYVPFDPAEPAPRRARALALAAPALVLTAGAPLPGVDTQTFDLTAWRAGPRSQERQAPSVSVGPDDTCYVIFTSGSTGEPKAVAVPQRALANHIAWVRSAFDFTPAERFLLRTPLGFDASIWELVHPLAAGASLVVADRATAEDSRALLALARAEHITVLQTVPSILRAWLDEPDFDALAKLTTLICAGEALPHALAREVNARSGARLFNLYGPTEACIDATWEAFDPDAPQAGCHSVPIGRAIHGALALVLDGRGAALPDGVTGELFIGGAGLASGYIGCAEESRQRFVELELAGQRVRLYRTGDRVRRLAGRAGGGRLEAMGRRDGQVKVRGMRIELGEIEDVLLALPGVVQAAVVAAPLPSGDSALHGFIVGKEQADPRSAVAACLPTQMVPSSVTQLERMPLTKSEKIDQQRLLEEVCVPSGSGLRHAPASATEAWLAEQLGQLLGTVPGAEPTNVEADFFAIGGHSLLATRLLARARQEFSVELSLREFLEQPTLASLASHIETALREGAVLAPIPRADRGQPRPASRAQERLWLLTQRDPRTTAYNMPGGFLLRGILDIERLGAALDHIVERHAILRTHFHEAAPGASWLVEQVVERVRPSALAAEKLAPGQSLQGLLEQEAERVFDLERGPLLVLRLIEIHATEHALLFNLHHILGDGWSLDLFARELAQLYEGRGPLPPLSIGFADFAAWERALPEPELVDWHVYLAGSPALEGPLELPADRPRPRCASHRGQELERKLPRALTERLRSTARGHEVSLHNLLLASFGCLLARLTGAGDLVLGAVLANRPRSETTGLIGFFVSALPVRLRIQECRNFDEALAETVRSMGFVQAHQDTGLDLLLASLGRAGDLAHDTSSTPLFQIGFDYAAGDTQPLALDGLDVEPIDFHGGTAKLDLNVLVQQHDADLSVSVEFATDLFDRATVAALVELWFNLTERLLSLPRRQLERHPLGTQAQRTAWIAAGRGPAVGGPVDSPLAQFERQVRARGATTALVFQDRTCSYSELDAGASHFAAELDTTLPAGPLGVLLPRSPEQVAALLGTWKANRAWIGLDPSDPIARRRQLATSARMAGLVCLDEHSARELGLAWIAPCSLDSTATASPAPTAPEHDHDAYLVGTSGTTGTPKCIVMGHRALANHNLAAQQHYSIGPKDTFLHRIPLTFDAALLELICPLALGARVVLASEDQARDPARVAELVRAEEVSVLVGVPSWNEALLRELALSSGARPRLLISGGEVIGPGPLAAWRAFAPGMQLVNAYGPAEACIEVTAGMVDPETSGPPPIGRALAGMSAFVLDAQGRPLPPGVEGELVLAGAGLARGYLGASADDEARFRDNHLTGEGRMYWTGDRAVRRSDGKLSFRGRRDREIKLGGRRFDPSEVEAVLAEHPAVRACAVLVDAAGKLSAHIELGDKTAFAELEAHCQARLPDRLVPAAWCQHQTLPRQPSGKPNLIELARAPHVPAASLPPAPAESELEAQLMRLFATQLGAPFVRRDADYFRSGGHSLGAIELVASIRETLGANLRLVDFFNGPSPVELATRLTRPADPARESRTACVTTWSRMRSDAELDRPASTAPHRTDGSVLLTGATGFLGAFLLVELLEAGSHDLVCLVRAKHRAEALGRIQRNAASYGLELTPSQLTRITALPGDLAAPRFGLGESDWRALAQSVGHILHNGAAVDFFRDYTALAPANVGGTRTALELAFAAGARFDLISTIGVLAEPPGLEPGFWPDAVDERTSGLLIGALEGLDGGYEQSKWVAERLTEHASEFGLNTQTFRPGRIAASARRSPGASNPDDFATRFLLGCLELGKAPKLGTARFDVTPVDYAARAIVALTLAERPPSAKHSTWHLLHPEPAPYRGLFDAATSRGQRLTFVPLHAWLEAARARPNPHLAALLGLLADTNPADAERLLTPDAALQSVSARATLAALADAGIQPPAIDAAYCARAIEQLESCGRLLSAAKRK